MLREHLQSTKPENFPQQISRNLKRACCNDCNNDVIVRQETSKRAHSSMTTAQTAGLRNWERFINEHRHSQHASLLTPCTPITRFPTNPPGTKDTAMEYNERAFAPPPSQWVGNDCKSSCTMEPPRMRNALVHLRGPAAAQHLQWPRRGAPPSSDGCCCDFEAQ